MQRPISKSAQRNRHAECLEELRLQGFTILPSVLPESRLTKLRAGMYAAREAILSEVGQFKLTRAGEVGVLRLAMKYSDDFIDLLECPEMLALVDDYLSPTAILHLQNGLLVPSVPQSQTAAIFQTTFHMDFPRVLNGYVASLNVLVCLDDFAVNNGATLVVPGSHQSVDAPALSYMEQHAIPVECPAGSLIAFDSTLWHAQGQNTSGKDRLAINHQFTRSFIKQQLDYVRALGNARVTQLPQRTQQLLGYYSRVPASLDEFYQPEESRFYRRYQG